MDKKHLAHVAAHLMITNDELRINVDDLGLWAYRCLPLFPSASQILDLRPGFRNFYKYTSHFLFFEGIMWVVNSWTFVVFSCNPRLLCEFVTDSRFALKRCFASVELPASETSPSTGITAATSLHAFHDLSKREQFH
jgi:hypothetical protein